MSKINKISLMQPHRLDAVQGAVEKRSEVYPEYIERASQPVTQHSAKSCSGVSGSAVEQAVATRRSA